MGRRERGGGGFGRLRVLAGVWGVCWVFAGRWGWADTRVIVLGMNGGFAWTGIKMKVMR